ncbi:hypothetical protein QU487_10215 [Crenobacter sp. SG2305]|uniref:hypothetical protein n=1 Tax=Crenobacter oryzisoli TaxID=3056844 RepID=UPI0025AB0E48|nr:hypothetical protein [Crenobacter sp. SG2305]MDN0083124.1 hypothetical protein [Crenobacter sp. SG2305]
MPEHCAPRAGPVLAADWSDNYLSYWYGTRFAEPGIADHISKNVAEFTHADSYKYGSNFFDVQTLFQ